MESAALSIHPFTLSKTLKPSSSNLHRHFLGSHPNQTLNLQLSAFTTAKCIQSTNFHRSKEWFLISFAANFLRNPSSTPPNIRRLASISSSAVAFGSGGGGDGSFGGNGGGGGDGGFNGGQTESKTLAAECDEVSASSPDVIILDVGGMTCGGCAASVKRILENQPQVSSASVNLATETAVVWVKPEVLVTQNWKKQVGENLAKHLTNCGFKSNLRGKLLMAKYPSLFWTPCAAHCIDLILHDIGKLSIVKKTLKKAISLNGYIYNHPFVLNMMRSFTKQRELIRPAVTRFATAYLTLQSIHNQKNSLRAMFCSEEWLNSRYHRDTGGRVAYETVMQTSFWTNILYVLKVMAPIVRVLRLVDSEKKPAMGYIYEAMDRAKEAIKRSFNDNEAKYGEIWNIIDLRWNAQLHHPLHAAGYYLNPEFYYTTEMIESIEELNYGLVTTIEKLIPDVRLQDRIHQELNIFREAVGLMGSSTAIRHRTTLSPDSAKADLYKVFERKMDEKLIRLKESGRELVVSWALCAVCLLGHASHFFGAYAPSWVHAIHSTGFHWSLSFFTLLGPGRRLILAGLKNLLRGAPNMDTLVGLGAMSSFAVSSVAALFPKLGWKVFFEEPIMLIAFVLLGRNLEQRAKIKATSDMTGLLSILPTKARLMLGDNEDGMPSIVEVSCNSLSVGDQIVVLPGDRVPADGIVRAGRSTVDESSFTGEPLPVTKLPGADVTAGSINLNGTLTVEVRRPGGDTVMGDIVRLVEEAQSREAPVQRLADKVAGHFTYGVMALSAATFVFWNVFGSKILPAAFQQVSSTSLALQLSCSVLVVACPCALGLATPTAVLVGTSLGATRGLLLRGGNILEKFAMVDTVVFDKTGTLTAGKPVVTKVVAFGHETENISSQSSDSKWSEVEVLRLAAGVESNTIHPVGKAILKAARAVGCEIVKAKDGTFLEEPGSGAVAIIGQKRVSVGTPAWLQRQGIEAGPFPEVDEFKNQSTVYVGVDGALAGLIYFEDEIRDDARKVVESLSKQGICTYMLSGDKKHAAEYVASIVGIPKNKVISGVKPEEKKKFISELQKDQKVVAMVGDGINDAAALASSDIGIAMGGGVGAASEVSSIVLMGNRLSQLVDALELSRLTMKTVKQNLWWAFAYNIVGLPIAAGVLLPVTGTMLTPSIAGALMGLSSVGVMSNSLLLRLRFSQKRKPIYNFSEDTESSSDSADKISQPEQPFRSKWRST